MTHINKTKYILNMKKIIIQKTVYIVILLFMLCSVHSRAQSSLEFSKVLLVSTSQTVPIDRVWKIESVISSSKLAPGLSYSSNGGSTNSIVILINGSSAYIKSWDEKNYANAGAYSAASGDVTDLPIWLPAGSSLEASTNTLYISVIEFKVVP